VEVAVLAEVDSEVAVLAEEPGPVEGWELRVGKAPRRENG
jgi:hypothetical protein